MSTFAVSYVCFWVFLMLWASVRWYPSTVDRVGHFLYQMFLLGVFLMVYLTS
jgi:hypothetical protein